MKPTQKETIEEYLDRGGKIKIIPRGVSGLDGSRPASRHIQYSKNTDASGVKPPNFKLLKELENG